MLEAVTIELKTSTHLIANVGTEGANEDFPIWTFFEFHDRFPHILLRFGQIILKPIGIFQNNSSAISDRDRIAKIYFVG
jgi:hypothetical protein